MKILYVVSRPLEINTSASIRNKATIEGLIENGNYVTVLTTEPDCNHSSYDAGMIPENLSVHYLKTDGVQSFAKGLRSRKALTGVRKKLYKIWDCFNVYDNLKGMVRYAAGPGVDMKEYDVIISSSDPKSSHLFVYEWLRRNRDAAIRWIQIWGDPFLNDISRRQAWMEKRIKKEEERLIERAEKVIYVSPLTLEMQKHTYKKYSEKMTWYPIPYIRKGNTMKDTVQLAGRRLRLAYCGDFPSHIRNIKPLYEYAVSHNVELTICGISDLCMAETERIHVLPRTSQERVQEIESEADILVHISNLYGTQIPGKIYQYSGTNKPILFILDGKKDELFYSFSKYRRFVFAENSCMSIQKAIDAMIRYDKDGIKYGPVPDFDPARIAESILK